MKYLFVDDDCQIDIEIWVEAATEKEARAKAWASLTDEQRDRCGTLDCVDQTNAP